MRYFYSLLALLLLCNIANITPAYAYDEFEYSDDLSPWTIRARLGVATPNYEESYNPTSVDDGDKDILSSAIYAETDIAYQMSPHFSMAASLGYAVQDKEDISLTSSSVTVSDNSSVSYIPSTLILRFHPAPYGQLNPYVGLGFAYVHSMTDFVGAEASGGSGLAIQAGFDYWFNNQYFLNVDFKQISAELEFDYTNSFNGSAVTGTYTYDPYFITAGMGVRF